MFDGKLKAVTFSYDDGVLQDERLVKIFDKYNLKATFNINSARFGDFHELERDGVLCDHTRLKESEIKSLYKNHEIAAHTLHHHNLTTLDDEAVIKEVEEDRLNLSRVVGYEVVGMAYPCGGVNNDARVAELLRKHTGIKYSRTTISTFNYDLQDNLLQFNPTMYSHEHMDRMEDIITDFINLKADKPQILYIWGHSYEFDVRNDWDQFEEYCKMLASRDDIFYGTNAQVLLK